MSSKGRIIELINSRKLIRYLLYGFAFILILDVVTTAFELIFMKGTREKNPIAYYLIQESGTVPGLIISVLFELIFWSLLYTGLNRTLQSILKKGGDNRLNVSNASWMIVLVIVFMFHFKGLINNLGVLFASF